MLTRTVRAETMLEALEQIKQELGSDALIVSARQIPGGSSWQVWKKPMVEVVAVKPEKSENDENPSSSAPESPSAVKMKESKAGKKSETAGGKKGVKSSHQTAKKTVTLPEPVKVETPVDQVEDTSPVDVKVKKAVFPEIKKENPAEKAAPQLNAVKNVKDSAPVEMMERLGILEAEAETRPEIEMTFADTFQAQKMPDPEQALEIIQNEAPNPVVAIEKFADMIAPRLNTRPEDMWPLLAKLHGQMKSQGLDEEILNRVTEVCLEMVSSKGLNDEKRIRDSLTQQLEAYIHIQKESDNTRQVICLVGASGAGKTSLCAKLAVKYHTSMKKRVAWISTDTIRTGAINQAKTYADAIGVPLQTAYTPEELYEAVAREKISDVVLVDTPSINPRSEASVMELGSFLTVLQHRSIWIVAPATAKTSDMVNLASTLSPFRPNAIALTKLDETNSFGSVFNLAWKTQLPLVYYSFGPRVMDELSSARTDPLVRAIFTERFDG
jgi:flagellar biosynthesis protein FlhF